ncbi:MAG: PaaI family thioesterase [Acidobacteriota bacterium]
MKQFEPRHVAFEERIRSSFALQRVMSTIGARLLSVTPGTVEIELDFREDLTQQDGYLHAGITTAIIDSACGYAALSLLPLDSGVLTVEFKVNLVAPARGSRFLATGRVIKPGRTLTLCSGEVNAIEAGKDPVLVAVMQTTMIRLAISRAD